jgi:hypothetical protein
VRWGDVDNADNREEEDAKYEDDTKHDSVD